MKEKFYIKSITMKNWKCFKFKTVTFKNGLNQFTQHNGFGKSTIFQAIIYCLYNKLPNTNSNLLKNDKSKPIELTLTLNSKTSNRKIICYRVIKSPTVKTQSIEFVDGLKVIRKDLTPGQYTQMMEKIAGTTNIFPLIWSNDPINNSKIFDFNFIKNEIFNNEFIYPEGILKVVKQNIFAVNKNIKALEATLKDTSKEELSKKVKDLEAKEKDLLEQVKSLTSDKTIEDSLYFQALNCVKAKRDKEGKMESISSNPYSIEEINRYNSLVKSKDTNEKKIEQFSESLVKIESLINKFKNFSDILKENESTGKCPLCGNDVDLISSLGLETTEIPKVIISKEDYLKCVDDLKELEKFDKNLIEISQDIIQLDKEISKVSNPEEIIQLHSDTVNSLFKELENVKNEIKNTAIQSRDLDKLLEYKKDYSLNKDLKEVIENYLNEKMNHLIQGSLFSASEILGKIDQKYLGLYLKSTVEDPTPNLEVIISNNGEIISLPIDVVSSGERSVVALSLILAYRRITSVPDFILFDESFCALDAVHLEMCFKMLENEQLQSLIINHN